MDEKTRQHPSSDANNAKATAPDADMESKAIESNHRMPTVVNHNCTVTINYNLHDDASSSRNRAPTRQSGSFDDISSASRTPLSKAAPSEAIPRFETNPGHVTHDHHSHVAKPCSLQTDRGAFRLRENRPSAAVAHRENEPTTDKEVLQFIRKTADTLWQETDLSDLQMQAITGRCCPEMKPSGQTRRTKDIAIWTLEYFQERMERCLERLEVTFQGTSATQYGQEMTDSYCPEGGEDDAEIPKPVDIPNSPESDGPQLISILDAQIQPPPSDIEEDAENSSNYPELSGVNNVEPQPNDHENQAEPMSARSIHVVPATVQLRTNSSPKDARVDVASNQDESERRVGAKVGTSTPATPTSDDAGLPPVNQPEDIPQLICMSDDSLETETRMTKLARLIEESHLRQLVIGTKIKGRGVFSHKSSSQPKQSTLTHPTPGLEDTSRPHDPNLGNELVHGTSPADDIEAESGVYVHRVQRNFTQKSSSDNLLSNRTCVDDDTRRQRLLESLEAGRAALAQEAKAAAATKNTAPKAAKKEPICRFCKTPFTEENNHIGLDGPEVTWPCSYHPGTLHFLIRPPPPQLNTPLREPIPRYLNMCKLI